MMMEESNGEVASENGVGRGGGSTSAAQESVPSPTPKKYGGVEMMPTYKRSEIPAFEKEVIENMKEEVDEARKLAEEWENRYELTQ